MSIRDLIPRLIVLTCLFSFLSLEARENRFYVYNAANGLADNSAQTLYCTKTGRLVITTMGQINFFDGQQFSYIDPSSENVYPLDNYSGNYHLYFDRFHHLWLKDVHSVTCVNLTTERFTDSITEIFKEFGIEDRVTDLFVDQTNVVWLLTAKGLYNVDTKRYYQIRQDRNLQDLEIYKDKYVLMFYDNGLIEVQEQGTGVNVFESKAYDQSMAWRYKTSSVLTVVGNSIYQLRNGNKEGVLLRFDMGKWKWTTLMQTPYHLNNMVLQDSLLYIPCEYGYWTYDCLTGELKHIEELEMAQGGRLVTDINAMAFDKQGGLWVGTEKRGLLYSRPLASPFSVYDWTKPRALELATLMDKMPAPTFTYRDRSVNCVFRDSRGWDWVGTSTGLQLYKSKSEQLPVVFTRKDGLLNNVVHTIIEDGSHNIWIGTSFGISCLLIQDDKLRYINSYNQWDKIPSESFVNGRAIRLSDGTIGMQMLDHVIEFNPDKMVTIVEGVSYEIYPKLIKLLVNGNEIRTGQELDGNVILKKALSRTKEINLNYNQNSVSLTFSALNYFRPQQTYYRVRVSGLDDTWRILTRYDSGNLVDSQGKLHLPLVALRPGSYVIEVQTSMIPDKWDTVPYEWIVNVNEPWWRTTGILALFGLVLLILIAVNAYYYMQNISMKATRNSEELGILKRIRIFAERCNEQGGILLEPVQEEYTGIEGDSQSMLTPEFIGMMERLVPVILKKDVKNLTMHELCKDAGMEIQPFYQLILNNIYKSPRPLAKALMLSKAEIMLSSTQEDVGEIAHECGFVTPNYFIATFYREYGMTPNVYRQQKELSKTIS